MSSEVATIGTRAGAVRADVQILDVARLDDPRLMSMLDVPLVAWARQCLEMGLKPLPKKRGQKYPAIAWEPYQTRFPRRDELTEWFARDDIDGVCVVLDGTGYVVIDCDGPRDRARRLLVEAGIEIPSLCPRVITGRDRDHFYLRTTRPVGRHLGFLQAEGISIDLLGEGVVVVPPSPHPETGVAYHWQPPILGTVDGPCVS